jgi:phospholipid/cholesterol/gamma-HCH transport system substrate-binding protein
MSKRKLEWKVGLFVFIGLVLAALMVMRFNKGTGLSSTYNLALEARNAGGIIPGSSVLMAGVPIGNVSDIKLAPDGSKVTMVSSIYGKYKIANNAIFSIATVGFLGDRYIAVSPGPTKEGEHPGFRNDGDTVQVQEAFDIAQVAESAGGLMDRLSGTVEQLSNVVKRLDASLLSDSSLSDLTNTIGNFRGVSKRALQAVDALDIFVRTNTPSLSGSISNFSLFTEKLNRVTMELQETLATNRVEFTAVVKNLEKASDKADKILADVENGKGLAGKLLKDEELASYTSQMMSNFMVLSSNVNHKGLWGVIRKPKLPKKDDN